MIKLIDLLKEAKNIGILYHTSNIYNAISIINSNQLKGNKFSKEKGMEEIIGVSTTRNKNFLYNHSKIQFILDGNKISNNYKIVPHDYWYRKYNIPGEPQTIDEDEEVILTPKGSLENLNKYLIQVNIYLKLEKNIEKTKEKYKELEDLLKENNIKYVVISK